MAEKKTQLVVIGAGPGGYTAAFYAADCGMEVTLIEAEHPGGTCLNVGCIPSKALLHIAKLLEETRHAGEVGIFYDEPKIDLKKVREYKNGVVNQLKGGVRTLAKARKVNLIDGFATFIANNKLSIKSSKGVSELEFEHCIIATGSVPVVPGSLRIDSKRVMDSTGALELADIPARFLVVGGGVIGLELGSVYASLGSKVTVIEALDNIANGVDRDIIKPLEKHLNEKFEAVMVKTMVKSLKEAGKKIVVEYENADGVHSDRFDRVLLCIGRRPNSDKLELEKAGLQADERGFIQVNKSMETSVPGIYAIGDLIGNPMLAHKASKEARVAVDKIRGKNSIFDNLCIPSVIYTDPEVAWTGLTEIEAKAKNIPYKLGKFPWGASGRALAMARTDGLTKVLIDPESERILGAAVVGVNAGELIAEACLAIEMGAVLEDVTGTIHAHPTLSETMMESMEAVHGLATHLFSPKKK
jgi:dihydrolipoamide dehydrogenase